MVAVAAPAAEAQEPDGGAEQGQAHDAAGHGDADDGGRGEAAGPRTRT